MKYEFHSWSTTNQLLAINQPLTIWHHKEDYYHVPAGPPVASSTASGIAWTCIAPDRPLCQDKNHPQRGFLKVSVEVVGFHQKVEEKHRETIRKSTEVQDDTWEFSEDQGFPGVWENRSTASKQGQAYNSSRIGISAESTSSNHQELLWWGLASHSWLIVVSAQLGSVPNNLGSPTTGAPHMYQASRSRQTASSLSSQPVAPDRLIVAAGACCRCIKYLLPMHVHNIYIYM